MRFNMELGGLPVFGDYIVLCNEDVIMVSFFDRAKNKVKACSAMIGAGTIIFAHSRFETRGSQYKTIFKPVALGRDQFIYTTCINKDIGTRFLITTQESEDEDVYAFLMEHYELPLLKEWSGKIFSKCLNDKYIKSGAKVNGNKARLISIHGRKIPLSELKVLDFGGLTENILEKVVSKMLRDREISFSPLPSKKLSFKGFDNYITEYGSLLVDNLRNSINSLMPLNGTVASFAAKGKRMYPQQAACVNGIIALMESGSRYGLMIEGMGCGKTLQAAGTVDAVMNLRWLKKNGCKNLQEVYLSEDQPRYRAIVMVPGHLLNKWKDEILNEIPGAHVTVIRNLACLINLRKQGKKPNGREWYLISKDTAKLGALESPIPTAVGKEYITENYCVSCKEVRNTIVYPVRRGGKNICPTCKGADFARMRLEEAGRQYGLLCPFCHSLLIKGLRNKDASAGDYIAVTLKPSDFSHRTITNSVCHVCGRMLWGVNAKPVSNIPVKEKKTAWHKITHYKNHAKKTLKTAYVLRGHEKEYIDENGVDEYRDCAYEYGPRRVALGRYIKKYLRGFFDICILDEIHKYEGGGTAQSNAAQALIDSSRFTLGLTGTISNGKADSFFYLLYMLDSQRMIDKGYGYEDVLKFSEKYGTIETIYENNYSDNKYNALSRGRMLQAPKVKPGISPLLFLDFLLDKGVFLDLSDLSKYLPPLVEQVVPVSMPDEVQGAYDRTIGILKAAIQKPEGGYGALSSLLTFGLSYPDKPYGRLPIMSGKVKDYVLARPKNFNEYAQENMLLPKEKKLTKLVEQEMSEGRNCFVYCVYTGKEETSILERTEAVIRQNCGLEHHEVTTISAASPSAEKREEWMHKKAAEGTKVFICNYKLVETGLDFCFFYKGKFYNYPTIIFLQLSHELSYCWQASRRGYRLNQPVECRNYYLVYEGTAQMTALEMMAEKQAAVSAIQGKFSVDGLASMARGIDPAVRIAQKLAENDITDSDHLKNMFDALQTSQNMNEDNRYEKFGRAILFGELMAGTGYLDSSTETKEEDWSIFDLVTVGNVDVVEDKSVKIPAVDVTDSGEVVDIFAAFNLMVTALNQELYSVEQKSAKKKKRKAGYDMEQSIFDLI